jgi:pyrimidine oxygenase
MPAPFSGEDLPSRHGGKDFGIFLPMGNGGWIISKNTPRLDASYAYNRRVAILAEEMEFDFIMSMGKWRGFGGETGHWNRVLESQVLMAALAEATSRIKIWSTACTLLFNPAAVAKMIATIDDISGGRAGLNVVTGAFRQEFAQMGAWRDDLGHDARYDFADEWVTAVKRLWSEESVTLDGKYVTLDDCRSEPKPAKRPFLVCAGMSPRGVDFTLDHMDGIFLTGRDNSHLREVSLAAKAQAAARGRTIKTYTQMTLVIGDTDAAAQAQALHYREGLDEGALKGMARAFGVLDSEMGEENALVASARSSFMTPRIIGSAETVERELARLLDEASLDGMLLIFPDYIRDVETFGRRILPSLRARFGGAERRAA